VPAPADPIRAPRVIAHRGAWGEAPENTLPAIARAIELGCAMAEIDLRYTSDGEVVVIHDATVDRTTDGTGTVASKSLAELRRLDAGVRVSPALRGTRVPTLQEVVELSRGRLELYLDLKETDPRPVVRAVERLQARSMVVYRPYSFAALQQVLGETPSARVLLDLGDWMQTPRLLEPLRSAFPTAAVSSDWPNWTPALLADARRLGMATYANVLGPNDTAENLAEALRLGYDYIQTDKPDLLLRLARENRSTGGIR
jgi:glycerophosphoryl diester phosphodiesterase